MSYKTDSFQFPLEIQILVSFIYNLSQIRSGSESLPNVHYNGDPSEL